MDWIWSSRCLELLCTSTQSSHLKWVSGGGINSPSHWKSRWLTATEKGIVGWTNAMLFSRRRFIWCPPRHLAVADPLTQLLRRYTPTVHRIIRCWRTLCQNLTVYIFKTVGYTAAPPSVHPVLKLQSWCVSVLIQMKNRIDRRCPHLDRRVLLSLLLLLCNSSGISRRGTVGSSDSVNFVWPTAQCTNYTDAMHRWYHWFILRCLFFSFSSCLQLGFFLSS
jgi:hypothetical protein